MIRTLFLTFLLAFTLIASTFAREGMWIPLLLDRNIDEMHQMGFQLSTDDIYNVNKASMKDAIVLFGSGCTGELISPDGLMITNHHCGYRQIQSHSSLENDYLTNGFWAMSREEELPNEGLKVTFLVEMRDVTDLVLGDSNQAANEQLKNEIRAKNIDQLVSEATEGTHYKASVKPFYSGNQYFLFITETFTDVRLVGAPPSAIGKFGGDTDNWMWPRHTGDFSMFRIYADANNQPADYSPDNIPYQPKKYFSINISGVEKDDFTMVFGYPGTTQQYLHSQAVKQILEQRNPDRIAIRDIKLAIMGKAMEADRGTRIQYAAKYASTSNAWKKWSGESKGLLRLDAIEVKKKEEAEFARWAQANEERQERFGSVLDTFELLYEQLAPYQKAKDYYDEAVLRGTDVYQLFRRFNQMKETYDVERELAWLNKHFKDYNSLVDQEVFTALMIRYHNDLNGHFVPAELKQIFNSKKPGKALNKLYAKSILADRESLLALTETGDAEKIQKKIKKDPLYELFAGMSKFYREEISRPFDAIQGQIDKNQTRYLEALLQKNSEQMMFPDANLTMRVTYGKVEGYDPFDGVEYKHYTTLEGIIEKDNPEIYDYDVPDRLKELFRSRDYGQYANSTGELPVCFVASNHTTGGNSGSPVIDANGHLIGINFDRCWEGTMSDIMFDPAKCRNIALDMRYMLFLVDKFAGASYLLDEMTLIK